MMKIRVLACLLFFNLIAHFSSGQSSGRLENEIQALADSLLISINNSWDNKKKIKIVFAGVENLNGEVSLLENYISVNFLHYLIQSSIEKVYFRLPRSDSSKVKRRHLEISSSERGDVAIKLTLIPSSQGMQLITKALKNPYLASIKTMVSWDSQSIDLYRAGNYREALPKFAKLFFEIPCPIVDASQIEFNGTFHNSTDDTIWVEEVSLAFELKQNTDTIYWVNYKQGHNNRPQSPAVDSVKNDLTNELFSFKLGRTWVEGSIIVPPNTKTPLKILFFQADNIEGFPEEGWSSQELYIDRIEVKLSNKIEPEYEDYGCKLSLAKDRGR